jgi:HEPN domain-containing protein
MKGRRKKLPPGSPQQWLNHAISDLALARLGLNSKDVLPEQICFHAQQAVEKALKAVLLHKSIRFPAIHDIEELVQIGRHEGVQFPDWAEDLASLTPYAVETRYPGHWEDFQETEVNQARAVAQKTVEWVKAVLLSKK